MMKVMKVLVIAACVVGAWSATLPAPASPAGLAAHAGLAPALQPLQLNDELAAPARARTGRAAQRWLDLVEEIARDRMEEQRGSRDDWTPRPFRLDLRSSDGGGGARSEALPVLVLPVPVAGSCKNSRRGGTRRYYYDEDDYEDEEDYPRHRPAPRPATRYQKNRNNERPRPSYREEDRYRQEPQPETPVSEYGPPPPPPPRHPDAKFRIEVPEPVQPPKMVTTVSSATLVREFRAQSPRAPQLPPALLARSPPPAPLPAPRARRSPPRAAPPPPRWPRTLRLKAELTVPRADYTEPYVMWFDGASGSARTEFHGGSTVTLSRSTNDGLHQQIEMVSDTSGRRCAVAAPRALSAAEGLSPGLPDLTPFQFLGYRDDEEVGHAEVWQHVTAGAAGAAGAAQGEALTTTHDLLLTRDANGDALPLKYSVNVDSSVLGPACDGYTHRYIEVKSLDQVDHKLFHFDPESQCDQKEDLEASNVEHRARLQPLLEFTQPGPDPRHDQLFDKFKRDFDRDYQDRKEESVRKNLVMQCTRFVTSGNRQAGGFSLGVNFLGDRLGVELDALLGVSLDAGAGSSHKGEEKFPHETKELPRLEAQLPREFDWRDEGAVTHVRYQGSCSSCWAMAVTGAVEGALFAATRRLVPLAEQTLVDCAQPYGANGCRGTWPSHAYRYIMDRGLPTLAEYGEHKEKVERCRAPPTPPATHIAAHVNVTGSSIPALKVAIKEHAPTVVIVDAKAKAFIFYKSGVLYDDRCAKSVKGLNHAVLAVGWGAGADGAPHFITKNSWSAAWGEAGYIRLQAPANTCGHLRLPSYPRLQRRDVDKEELLNGE